MKKKYWFSIRGSIRNRIYYSSILIVTILSIITSIRSYQISVEILQEKVSSALFETLSYVGNGVEKELRQVEQVSDFIFSDVNIRRLLNKNYTDQIERIRDINRMDELFNSYSVSTVFSYLSAIKIFGNKGEEYSYGGQVYELDSNKVKSLGVQEILSKSNKTQLWSGIHEAYLQKPFEKQYVISLFRLMMDEKYERDTGLLYMSIRPDIFGDLLRKVNLQNNSEIYIVDNYNKVVFHSGGTKQFYRIDDIDGIVTNKDKEHAPEMLVSSYTIAAYGWKVYGTIPMHSLTDDNKRIILTNLKVTVLVLIIAAVVWYFILLKITKPLKALANTMKSVDQGNMYVKFECDREDEIGQLAGSFNYMMDKMHSLFDNLLKEQYKALQAQINPHFLYNTLNSIRWMAIIHKVDNIKEVIDALSQLIMNSTKSDGQFITVDEELKNLKAYIHIQKLRYNNSFDVEFDVEEEVRQCQCISFILQPQVENAIFHGLEPKDGFGLIRVSVRKRNGVIVFTIWDNGIGMTREQINRVLNEEKKGDRGFSGIGIKNVNERIKLLYGKQYGINIKSVVGQFTSVEITIPEKTYQQKIEGHISKDAPGGTEDV